MNLTDELTRPPAWMYPWSLDGRTPPLLGLELPSIHKTRAAMIEPWCRRALQGGGTAIDLGCSEGWYAHRLLEWGADRVLAIDVREQNVRRGELIRDHYGIPKKRLEFRAADVYSVEGRFDVVLCLGLIYHLENPIGALRVARRLTGQLCLVETQAAVSGTGARYTWGTTDEYLETEALWATRLEPAEDQSSNPIASHGGVVSLIPNRAALVEAMQAAGFKTEVLSPPEDANRQFTNGDRLVALGTPSL